MVAGWTMRGLVLAVACATSGLAADWKQWGGPNRSFHAPSSGLAPKWADTGPTALWKRPLGEGYSAIVGDEKTLYTMFRSGDDEHVVCLNAANGETRWQHTYSAPLLPKSDSNFGRGPNATPLLLDDRVVTVGFTGKLYCLNAADGKVLWSHDLYEKFGATFLEFGYSASPLAFRDMVILPIGAKGRSVVALSAADGSIRWESADFDNSYSSPLLVDVNGRPQVTLVMTKQIIGLDAESGKLAWTHPFVNQWDTHCTTPVDCGNGRLFFPSFGGGVALQVKSNSGGQTDVSELWTTKKVGAGQTNVVCVGDHLYGASGSGRASFLAAVSMKDGKETWRERVPLATVLYADGRLIVLDENGELSMAAAAPEKLTVASKAALLENKAWTAPTLIGTRLFLRDQKHILAVDLAN